MNAPENAGSTPPGKPTGSSEWARLRLWQIQPVRDLLLLGGVVGLLWLGYRLSVVTVPLLLAVLLAYLFEPLVQRLTRSGRVGRSGVAVGVLAGMVLLVIVPVAGVLGLAAAQGVSLAGTMASDASLMVRSIDAPADDALRAELASRPRAWIRVRDYVVEQQKLLAQQEAAPGIRGPGSPKPSELFQLVRPGVEWARANAADIATQAVRGGAGAAGTAANFVAGVAGRVGSLLLGAFLTAFFFFFVCTSWGRFLVFWRGLIPERKQARVVQLMGQMDRVIAAFVRGRLTICAVLAVYYTLAYKLIGVNAWMAAGPAVGLLALIPYAQWAAAPLVMVLMLVQPPGGWQGEWWWIVFAPLGCVSIAQLADDYLLTPRIQGKSTGMDTPTILFASLAGGTLAGIYGLLVAIPVAACLKILLKEVFWPRFRAWGQGRERDFLPIER